MRTPQEAALPTTTDRRTRHPAPSAADEIGIFARLFEERRADEDAGRERSTANAREMDLIAHSIQRRLEYIGRSWLDEAGDHGRPEALVAVLAFGRPADYHRHADQALEQLREAEALYRAGDMETDTGTSGGSRRRRRSRRGSGFMGRRVRIATIVLAGLVMWGLVLAACGSWGIVDDPIALTFLERPF